MKETRSRDILCSFKETRYIFLIDIIFRSIAEGLKFSVIRTIVKVYINPLLIEGSRRSTERRRDINLRNTVLERKKERDREKELYMVLLYVWKKKSILSRDIILIYTSRFALAARARSDEGIRARSSGEIGARSRNERERNELLTIKILNRYLIL